MISIVKFSKGHSSLKLYVEFKLFFSAHHLIMLFICNTFHENISKGFRVIEWT